MRGIRTRGWSALGDGYDGGADALMPVTALSAHHDEPLSRPLRAALPLGDSSPPGDGPRCAGREAIPSRRLDRQSVAHDLHHARGVLVIVTAMGRGKASQGNAARRAMPDTACGAARDPSHSRVHSLLRNGMKGIALTASAPWGRHHGTGVQTTAIQGTNRLEDEGGRKTKKPNDVVKPGPWWNIQRLKSGCARSQGRDLNENVKAAAAAFDQDAPWWRRRGPAFGRRGTPASARSAVRRRAGQAGTTGDGGTGRAGPGTPHHSSAGVSETGHWTLGQIRRTVESDRAVRAGRVPRPRRRRPLSAQKSETRERLLCAARPGSTAKASGRHRRDEQQFAQDYGEPLSLRRGATAMSVTAQAQILNSQAQADQTRKIQRGILEDCDRVMIGQQLPRSRWLPYCDARRRPPRGPAGRSPSAMWETDRRGGARKKMARGPSAMGGRKAANFPTLSLSVRNQTRTARQSFDQEYRNGCGP